MNCIVCSHEITEKCGKGIVGDIILCHPTPANPEEHTDCTLLYSLNGDDIIGKVNNG